MAKKSPETIELDALTKKLEDAISGSDKKSKSERYTEDLFKGFFESVDIGLRADRDDVPSIKTPTGTWRPDGVVRSADAKIYEVFELKKPSVKICVDQSANYPAASAIFQAVRYIAASHTYKSTKEIKRVFCFNGIDLLCVSPVSDEQLKLFLNRSPWKDTIGKDDLETEKILKASCALVEAYFKFEYLASLPSHEDVKDKLLFRHQVRHFSDSLLRAIGIETSVVRATITKANLKEIYEEFCSLVTKKPEEHFVRIAPVWTRNNLFWFGKNGFLHVFQKDGTKVCDIPRGDIKNQDLDAVKRLLECHVLDSPETFYDNYDTLLKPEVRKRLGSYFTKKGLAGFAQFFIAEKIGNLSEFYILDPAAGSGTLLANLKAKSVFGTDIHQFKYSLMRQRGVRHFSKPIDFLNTQPEAYVSMLNEATDGDVVKKPLLVLSNPPYLGHSSPDDLESTLKAEVKNSKMMSNDLCSFFMVQITRLFYAESNGLGEDLDGFIGIFSPTTWIDPGRGDQKNFRDYVLSKFSYEAGFKIDGSKFFDDMSSPVLFSLLKRRKKISWKEQDLKVDMETILDLTRSHKEVSAVGSSWAAMPSVVKSGFETPESMLSKSDAAKFRANVEGVFSKKTDTNLSEFIASNAKFSKILKTSHSQTGGNETALSEQLVSEDTSLDEVCREFKQKLKLKMSNDEICGNLQVIYDDRPSLAQGYRFVYLDQTKFKTQSIVSPAGPVLNFFEEIKKSKRNAKFYNAAPITTDIAVAEIPKDLIRDYSVKTVGFKTCGSGTPENTYLTDFGKNVGDARSLFFLRAMLSYLPSFKELTNDKAIDSSLVWAPNVKSDTAALKEFCLLAFCHAVASSNFGEFKLEYGKHSWKVEDYFKKDGWLETSGLMTNIFHNFMRQADSEVATVCKAAMKTRNGDVTKLEELAEHRFQAAGFLPAGKKKKAG